MDDIERHLKVASARALQEVLKPLGAKFAHDKGIAVEFDFAPVGTVRQHLDGGQLADVIILSAPVMQEYEDSGRVVAGSRTVLGHVGIVVAVRDGAPAPNISTPAFFKSMLLDVRSIACSDPAIGGSAGTHFAAVLKQLGIEDEVKPKVLLQTSGANAGHAVARGEAEVAITLLSEIVPVRGVHAAAPLPEALQKSTVYVAGVAANSGLGASARAFIRAAADPSQAAAWKAAGVEPAHA